MSKKTTTAILLLATLAILIGVSELPSITPRLRELSDKAKENLDRIAESRKKDSKFVRLEPGEKTTLQFNPQKIDRVEAEFDGKKSIRYQYAVTNPKEPEQPEKYLTVSKRNSALIDTYLAEGKSVLKIHRIGAGKDTQYVTRPA